MIFCHKNVIVFICFAKSNKAYYNFNFCNVCMHFSLQRVVFIQCFSYYTWNIGKLTHNLKKGVKELFLFEFFKFFTPRLLSSKIYFNTSSEQCVQETYPVHAVGMNYQTTDLKNFFANQQKERNFLSNAVTKIEVWMGATSSFWLGKENLEEMGLNEIRAINNIQIVASNKPSDIPENYYCLSQSLGGHFVGYDPDKWFGKFAKNKNNGPFIAFERSNKTCQKKNMPQMQAQIQQSQSQPQSQAQVQLPQKDVSKEGASMSPATSRININNSNNNNNSNNTKLYPITKICIRDVNEYLQNTEASKESSPFSPQSQFRHKKKKKRLTQVKNWG
ncbi:hypothetical protein RFI_34322 [Reticulomyxa filosa]|uniref:Uncharacterized protein n=1 Tax=Reticulomyxa filosa TaxID=46433 RepID=X6LMC2_RETFI|nr:hypothetical protein RFI_34322 [Reticulomyxa filosa]|eukprot:ETO03088.1 hypothetical protein RFI_34322 [Reticulomyxa filosa]